MHRITATDPLLRWTDAEVSPFAASVLRSYQIFLGGMLLTLAAARKVVEEL
jgi:hypothetical protein